MAALDDICRDVDGAMIAERMPPQSRPRVIVTHRGNLYWLLKPSAEEYAMIAMSPSDAVRQALLTLIAAGRAWIARRRWRRAA